MVRSDAVLTLLLLLAVARLTHLVTVDTILDRPRAWVGRRAGRVGTWLAVVIQCPWCVSIWLGAGAAVTAYNWHGWWFVQVPLLLLAASYVAGYLEQLLAAVLGLIKGAS